MVRVKICGVRTEAAAYAIDRAGADFAGLNFVPSSRRCIDTATATRIISRFERTVPVGVFADQSPEDVARIAGEVGLEWVQLHGKEPCDVAAELSRRFRVIRAFTMDDSFDPTWLEAHVRWVELFLFDAARPGSGRTFDWSLVPRAQRPFLLAGGLTPENVAGAIAAVDPFGVDTASGVEVDGGQDAERIGAFVRAAKAGEALVIDRGNA